MACQEYVEGDLLKFRHPFTAIVAGATMTGKTEYVARIIKNREDMIVPPVQRVIYSYKKWQPAYEKMDDKVEFVQGMNFELNRAFPTLLVVDDQMATAGDKLTELFTVSAHHENCSTLFITQNIFFQNKAFRTASLNSQYLILFKNPRDASQIMHLARQMYPSHKAKTMIKAYENATSIPYGTLVVDLKPDTPSALRLRSNVLPDEGLQFGPVRLAHCYPV
jgi:hypothetical protein